jgi:hypothetical protein
MLCLSSLTDSDGGKGRLFRSTSTGLEMSQIALVEVDLHRQQEVQFWKGLFCSLLMESRYIQCTAEKIRDEFEKRFDDVVGQLGLKQTRNLSVGRNRQCRAKIRRAKSGGSRWRSIDIG